MATFMISDTHFGHAALIRMLPASRPFADVSEMDNVMRDAWNATVRPDDTVIHLGDFAHRHDPAKLPKLFASLNGYKHLIKGNHDDNKHTLALPWASVRDVAFTSIDSQYCVLNHYPWRTWPRIRRGALMLYGHTHGRMAGNVRSCDIGVDVMGFAPVRLSQIKAHMATLPLMNDPEARDEVDVGGVKP
jgi:calcineurin-like phosphoesterase family protein